MDCSYHRILDLSHCNICKIFLRLSNSTVARHFRQVHGLDNEASKNLQNDTEMYRSRAEPLNEGEESLKKNYLKYVDDSKAVSVADEILPLIEELQIEDGYQCCKCFFLFKAKKFATSHIKSCVGGKLRYVKVQRLFGGKSSRYFRVLPPSNGWINKEMMKMDAVNNEENDPIENVAEMNSLVSLLRFDQHLAKYDISMTQARSLCGWEGSKEQFNEIRLAIGMYMESALTLSRNNVFIKTHSFMDSPMYLSIESSSIDRYKNKLVPFLFFLLNITSRTEGLKKDLQIVGSLESTPIHLLEELKSEKQKDSLFSIEFHKLMLSLFLTSSSQKMDFVPFFITCSSVSSYGEDGDSNTFMNGAELSPLLAAMLYLIRCIVVNEIYGVGRKLELERGIESSISASWKRIIEAVSDNEDCGAAYVRYCMNLCNSLRKTEMSEVRFIICHKHLNCGILDGIELSLNTLGKSVISMQFKLISFLDEKLLFGFYKFITPSFWLEVDSLCDHFTNRSDRYWFGKHPSNISFITKWRRLFSDHLENGIFETEGEKNDLVKGRRFLESAEEFLQHMFWLLQTSSGGPARSTELGKIQVENGKCGTRNIFLLDSRLFYVINYHKGRAKLGGAGKPIARFPDLETSKLLFLYVVFVKPLEKIMSKRLDVRPMKAGSNPAEKGGSTFSDIFLFCNRGNRIGVERLRCSFKQYMVEFGFGFNIRQYRQYHVGAIKNLLKGKDEIGELNVINVMKTFHSQTGHSSLVANDVYGVSECDMRKLDATQLENFRIASINWHSALGLIQNEKHVVCQSASSMDLEFTNSTSDKNITINDWNNLNKKFDVIENKLISIYNLFINKTNAESNFETKNRILHKGEIPNEEGKIYEEEEIIETVRTLCGNKIAQFRSEEQKKSLMTVCNVRQDALFIFPTGSGKSMLYLVPAILRQRNVMVVIVPLVSLQMDISRRCRTYNIQTVLWEQRHSAGTRIVLVSVEHTVKDSYREFVCECYSRGVLYAIFVDEAHLFIQWSEFRSVMSRVSKYLRPKGVDVPIFGMTATCTPPMEEALENILGMKNSLVVREVKGRLNTEYEVRVVDNEDFEFDVISIIREEIKQLINSSDGNVVRAISYCQSREECERIATSLNNLCGRNMNISKYHAGMSKTNRALEQTKWLKKDGQTRASLMIATSAFGCGIDVADVRVVLHIRRPRSIMSFIQESGRSGRDGKLSRSVVIDLRDELTDQYLLKHKAEIRVQSQNCDDGLDDSLNELVVEQTSIQCEDYVLFGDMHKFINQGKGDCRRWPLEEYNDGKVDTRNCEQRGSALCDLCKNAVRDKNDRKSKRIKTEENETLIRHLSFLSSADKTGSQLDESRNKIELVEDGTGQSMENCTLQEINNNKHILRTPKTSKRPFNLVEEAFNDVSTPSNYFSSQSQSQSVTPLRLTEVSSKSVFLCAICSVMKRKCVRHGSGRDEQNNKCFTKRCLRCASKLHSLKDCFMLKFQEKSGWCHACSFSLHAKAVFHPPGTYGRRICPNQNAIRILTVVFEDPELRVQLNQEFPEVARFTNNNQLVEWLRICDNQGYTWYADVLTWVHEKVLII